MSCGTRIKAQQLLKHTIKKVCILSPEHHDSSKAFGEIILSFLLPAERANNLFLLKGFISEIVRHLMYYIIITPPQRGCWVGGWVGYIGFTPSVRASVPHPVSALLSNNFRRCVACLCLVFTWDLMWITSMGTHMGGWNAGVLVVLVIPEFYVSVYVQSEFLHTPDSMNAHTGKPNVCLYSRNASVTCWLIKDWLLWVSIVYSPILFVLCICVYLYMMISRRRIW